MRFRLFYAIELPTEIKHLLGERIDMLRNSTTEKGISWATPEKLHITIKFFGSVEATRVNAISSAADKAVANLPVFRLVLDKAGRFPARGPARVLWVGLLCEQEQLVRLVERLEDECAREDFPREDRVFHPHITVARIGSIPGASIRSIVKLHEETPLPPNALTVREIVLMRSDLSSKKHTVLSRHPLAESQEPGSSPL